MAEREINLRYPWFSHFAFGLGGRGDRIGDDSK